ncbi:alkaline phosphatase family protein [Mycoplasmatota bacterium WC30]
MKKAILTLLILTLSTVVFACDKTSLTTMFISSTTNTTTNTTNTTNTTSITSTTEVSTNLTTTGGNVMGIYGTYNRAYPSYYEKGKALIEDAHVVYINWDGFARYYYDELLRQTLEENAPTLYKLVEEGVFFNNLRNTMPSITNPVQNQILSGGTSAITHNVYRYYNKSTNTVIQQLRDNDADTIVNVAVENGLSVVGVNHFLAEQYLTRNDPTALYVTADPTNPEVVLRGEEKSSDHFSRSEQLEKILKGEPVNTYGNFVTVTELPNLMLLYADDLDALGHNFTDNYGYERQLSEEGRMNNIITALKEMDAKLSEIIAVAKAAGVYDDLTFFLTTDHGMTPYGASSLSDTGDYVMSKFGELKTFIEKYNSNFKVEFVGPNKSPANSTNVVAVGANLNLQLTFKEGISDEEIADLKTALLQQYYVGKVMTRLELEESGYWMEGADMVVSPSERYCFSASYLGQYIAKGQHDSLADTSNQIVGWIWGKGIKENYVYEDIAYNYDFGITMAAALGLELPEANGIVLDVFDIEEDE